MVHFLYSLQDTIHFSGKVSISPIFCEQIFHMKVFCGAFMCLQFGFVNFWQKDFGAKAANKMLVKLTGISHQGFSKICRVLKKSEKKETSNG